MKEFCVLLIKLAIIIYLFHFSVPESQILLKDMQMVINILCSRYWPTSLSTPQIEPRCNKIEPL